MSVGLVVVSHSTKIAEGVCDLAQQMAPDVRLAPAGGTDNGGIGTSFEKIQAAIESADSGDGVVVLCDLGSAVMTAETAVEFLDDPSQVLIADAPVVEGAVSAAVSAQGGGGLRAVQMAAESAASPAADPASAEAADAGSVQRIVTVVNEVGLHARPAALLVQQANRFDAEVQVNGADATSLLAVMSLGARQGTDLLITASGAQAQQAVDALADLVTAGLGEV